MKTTSLLLAVSLLGFVRFSFAQINEADEQKFEQKYNAKIIKAFDVEKPNEGLVGGTSIAVAYSGTQKFYVAYGEKNSQKGYGSAWIFRSSDEGATWSAVVPSGSDIPAAYADKSWRTDMPTFALEQAWIRRDAYENNKPKSYPEYLSGYWSSSGTSLCVLSGTTWVSAPGTDTTLANVPICVYWGTITKADGETEQDGFYETGTTCQYRYRFNFKVPRSGWGSGRDPSLTTSGTDAYEIISASISPDGNTFDATYYHYGNCKRTFVRDSSPTSGAPAGKPDGAADPHSVLIGPAGLASYTPPSAAAQPAGTTSGLGSMTDLSTAAAMINTSNEMYANTLHDGVTFGSLFYCDGSGGSSTNTGLYLLSLGHSSGDLSRKLCIRKSTDAGATWTGPSLLSNVPGDYVASSPAYYGGRIWIAYGATQVMSALVSSDWTDRANWIISEDSGKNGLLPRVPCQKDWLKDKAPKDLNFLFSSTNGVVTLTTDVNSVFPDYGFTESSVVAGPDDSGAPGVWLLPKVDSQPYTAKIGIATGLKGSTQVLTTQFTGTAASQVTLPEDHSFNPDTDLIYLPGGEKKFIAQYISGTGLQPGKFYALSSPELEPYQCARLADRDGNPYSETAEQRYAKTNHENPGTTRNTGAIYTSTNLVDWHLEKIFVHSAAAELSYAPDYGKVREGFSAFSFTIDGDDMLIVSRTAADIGQWEDATIDYTSTPPSFIFANRHFPRRSLDANIVSFHRVKNFRNLTRNLFLAADEMDNKVYLYEATNGDPAKVGEFRLPGETGVSLPSGVVQSGSTGDVFISKCTSGGTIERYARDGTYSSRLCAFPAGSKPVALTMGSASNLLYALVSSSTNVNLYKVTIPASGTGTPTLIPTLASNGATVNLAAEPNGLAVASTGLIYASTPGGFGRISTTGGTVAVTTSPVQAFSRGGANLYVVQNGTNSSGGVLNFSTLSNTTLTPLSTGTFAAPTTGLSQTGTSLYFTGSAAEGWEMLSSPFN